MQPISNTSALKKNDEGKREKEVNDFDKLSVLICFFCEMKTGNLKLHKLYYVMCFFL